MKNEHSRKQHIIMPYNYPQYHKIRTLKMKGKRKAMQRRNRNQTTVSVGYW